MTKALLPLLETSRKPQTTSTSPPPELTPGLTASPLISAFRVTAPADNEIIGRPAD